MPGASVFIDSNTFLYTMDPDAPVKAAVAQGWLKTLTEVDKGVTNLQVLNEVTSVLTRKFRRFDIEEPFFRIDAFSTFGAAPLSGDAAYAARALFLRYRYSWWDCLLLASALELGCTHFLSEDMQDSQHIALSADRSLTLVDPFAHSPDDILTQH